MLRVQSSWDTLHVLLRAGLCLALLRGGELLLCCYLFSLHAQLLRAYTGSVKFVVVA